MARQYESDRPRDREGNGRSLPEERSIGTLIKELGDESTRMIRQEVELARAEMREKVEAYERNLVKLVVGGVLLVGAAFVLLVALNRGLTALLAQFVDLEVAVWLAPLVLAGVIAAVGWSMTRGAKENIRREGLTPNRTVDSIREEKNWVKHQAKEMRHG